MAAALEVSFCAPPPPAIRTTDTGGGLPAANTRDWYASMRYRAESSARPEHSPGEASRGGVAVGGNRVGDWVAHRVRARTQRRPGPGRSPDLRAGRTRWSPGRADPSTGRRRPG